MNQRRTIPMRSGQLTTKVGAKILRYGTGKHQLSDKGY